MTRFRLYRIEPCYGCADSFSGLPRHYDDCDGEDEVRTEVVVYGPSSAFESFMASDGMVSLRTRGADAYYPVEVPDE